MKIINGQELAKSIKDEIKNKVLNYNKKPCLAVIVVGDNPASKIYVANKEKACDYCGFNFLKYELKDETTEKDLLNLIENLNNDKNIDGILVQLPVPKHISENKIILAIDPDKDIDCFHPLNFGLLFSSKNNKNKNILPCTANGCLKLIKTVCKDLTGKIAVVIGRSNLIGKPIAQLLLNENCTTIITHSKTKNLEEITKQADIIVIAIGKANFLKQNMVKDNVIVIDVGINRLENGSICGDADFENIKDKCAFITPVPKGVGPMTIACLMENTFNFFLKHNNYI